MQRILLLFIMFCCITAAEAQTYSFVYDGSTRSYIVHLPTGYSASGNYALVLNFHGLTSNASQQQSLSGMNAVADANKFIVVYPNGLNNSWNAGINNANVDDVGFVNALIDRLKSQYAINLQQVYATGFSMGGYFSYRLACRLSNRIAAIAPVSGLLTNSSACAPVRSMPVLHIHGTSDGIVPYSGVASSLSYWRNYNKCTAAVQTTMLPNDIELSVYGGCSNGVEIRHYKINGAGHTWPRTNLNASQEIWNFFKRFTLNSQPSNTAPVVSITAPAGNASFTAPATINITANATDANGTVAKVEFYQGSLKLGEDLTSPYSFSWTNVAAGTYSLTAKATDNQGESSTSSTVSVTVTGTGGGGTSCVGVPAYSYLVDDYAVGSKVVNYNRLFECKSAARCNGYAGYYAPGYGTYWENAWTYLGTCSAARIASLIEQGIGVHPNPAVDKVFIEFESEEATQVSVSLADVLSRNVVSESFTAQVGENKFSLDVSKLQKGLHILTISYAGEKIVRKIYVTR